jgi:hypothetical protein
MQYVDFLFCFEPAICEKNPWHNQEKQIIDKVFATVSG